MSDSKFATAINCMDGRVQEPVSAWFKIKKGYDFVDTITEPGPIKWLAESNQATTESIKNRLMISVEKHGSRLVAVVGHYDCAGNPVDKDMQLKQIREAIAVIKSWNTGADVVGLYVNEMWAVEEVPV